MFGDGFFGKGFYGNGYFGPAAPTGGGGGGSADPPRRWSDWTWLMTPMRSSW